MLPSDSDSSKVTDKDSQDTESQKKKAWDRKRMFDSECVEFTRNVMVILLTGGMLLGIALVSLSCKECLFVFVILSACLCRAFP